MRAIRKRRQTEWRGIGRAEGALGGRGLARRAAEGNRGTHGEEEGASVSATLVGVAPRSPPLRLPRRGSLLSSLLVTRSAAAAAVAAGLRLKRDRNCVRTAPPPRSLFLRPTLGARACVCVCVCVCACVWCRQRSMPGSMSWLPRSYTLVLGRQVSANLPPLLSPPVNEPDHER